MARSNGHRALAAQLAHTAAESATGALTIKAAVTETHARLTDVNIPAGTEEALRILDQAANTYRTTKTVGELCWRGRALAVLIRADQPRPD